MTTDDFTPTYDFYGNAIFRYYGWKCRDREVGQDMIRKLRRTCEKRRW